MIPFQPQTFEREMFSRGPLYNVVEVLGRKGLVGTARHEASVSDPKHIDYLGRERLLRVIDEDMTTQNMVDGLASMILERVCHSVTYERRLGPDANMQAMEAIQKQLEDLNRNLGGGPRHKSAIPTTRP